MKKSNYVASNFREIRDYLAGFAEGNEEVEHYLFQAFTDYLANYQTCLRPMNENEKGQIGKDTLLSQTSDSILGKRYMFDPSLDKGLNKKLEAAVKFIKASLSLKREFNSDLKKHNPAIPFMLSTEFLRVAATQNQGLPQASLLKVFEDISLSHQPENNLGKAKDNVLINRVAQEKDTLKKYEDGGSLVRYHNYDEFYEQYKKLSFCLSAKVSRSRLESGTHSYCALLDKQNEPLAFMMFVNNDGIFELSHLKSKGGTLPTNEVIDKMLPYLEENQIPVRGTENTGILISNNKYYNVFNLPDNVNITNSDIVIQKDPREFSLNKLQTARSISITDCENFKSLGSLARVNQGLDVNGCSKLDSLGDLRLVGSSLSIKNTAITDFPGTLKKVGGFIRTDFGTYETIFFAKFRLRREYPRKQNKGLPYSGPVPW